MMTWALKKQLAVTASEVSNRNLSSLRKMLEEGLRSPTFSPSEAAQGLLSFVRFELPDGGANAEKRFIGLFSLLCDRLFGPMAGSKDDFRHEVGGWLSRQNRWDQQATTTSSVDSSISRPKPAQSMQSDPVVQLLGGMESLKSKEKLPTLLEAISSNTEPRRGVRVQFPFRALPKPTQDVLLDILQSATEGKVAESAAVRSNAARLFGELIQVPIKNQTQVRQLESSKKLKQESNRPLSLSPSSLPKPKEKVSTDSNGPQIMLSMIEYFLLTFIRYPSSPPAPTQPAPQGRPGSRRPIRKKTAYGDVLYSYLFEAYVKHFVAMADPKSQFLGFPSLKTDGEIFLRTIAEIWLCGKTNFVAVSKAAGPVCERRRAVSVDGTVSLNLDSMFDVVKVKYDPPPALVQRCLPTLIIHLVKDPNLTKAVKDCSGSAGGGMNPWCISPAMTLLQQDFYNFIVTTFRHAPIHVRGSPFFTAFDCWLSWIEPWNVEFRRRSAPTMSDFSSPSKAGHMIVNSVHNISPKSSKAEIVPTIRTVRPTSRSRYSEQWKPYVAANLHLYTVPLALFIRRARELDFSSAHFSRSFATVRRVFRVFSPMVVDAVNELLASNHSFGDLVATHEKTLGEFSPSKLGPGLKLASLGGEMHSLLEEISMQHMKTVRERNILDRMEASVESFFNYVGLVSSTPGAEKDIEGLVGDAKMMVGLPRDYEAIPKDSNFIARTRGRLDGNDGRPERFANGSLTDRGREQILSGAVKCDAIDVALIGHSGPGRIKSYEISPLVTIAMQLSEWLNDKIGLSTGDDLKRGETNFGRTSNSSRFAIDLRFLADYRNLLFIAFMAWLLRMFSNQNVKDLV